MVNFTGDIMLANPPSLKGISVWLVCVLFYLYEFLLRTLLGTFQNPITADLNLNPLNFALLSSSAYLLVYGVMQIPVGIIFNRIGLKKAMLFAALVCTIATLGFSFCEQFHTALFFRALMGLGSSFGFIAVLFALYDWMPYRYIALYIGISQFLGTMGPMAAGGPLNSLIQSSIITWRDTFSLLSIMGLILFILIAFFVDNNRKMEGNFIVLKRPADLKKDFLAMMKDRQVWGIALFCAFVYFNLEYLSENECKNLLIAKGYSSVFASYMITLSWLGFAIGSPLFGYISDKISRRRPILIFSAISTASALFGIIYLPLTSIAMSLAFFIFGVGVGSSSVGIVNMGEQFTSDKVSTGLGVNNAIAILLVSVLAPIISFILSFHASTSHVIPLAGFQQVFIFLVCLPLMALFIAVFFIKETFAKSSKERIILNTVSQ
jgi:MFS family permease